MKSATANSRFKFNEVKTLIGCPFQFVDFGVFSFTKFIVIYLFQNKSDHNIENNAYFIIKNRIIKRLKLHVLAEIKLDTNL